MSASTAFTNPATGQPLRQEADALVDADGATAQPIELAPDQWRRRRRPEEQMLS